MHALTILGAAIALCGSSSAMPAAAATADPQLEARNAIIMERNVEPTAPWVEIDDEGRPSTTFTPTMTTISGTPSAINGAPHDLTASVYTFTSYGVLSTSTGEPPNPRPTGKSNQGSFSRCYNMDGENAPFCRPSLNSTLFTGNTYYVTWDPDFYNKTGSIKSNITYEITVRLDFLNKTSNQWEKLETYDENKVPASWGFWPLKVESKLLSGHKKYNNVTITLLSAPVGSNDKKNSFALPVVVEPPRLDLNKPTPKPAGRTLYIALPVCLGTIALLLIGVCMFNRSTRRIELGNIMSRARHGYSGRKTRRRMFKSKRDNGIQLDGAEDAVPRGEYRDDDAAPQLSRRDSEGLGSLAGSPTDAHFEQQGTTGGSRNAFRDEVSRQDSERRGAPRH